jgi:hypothetical protein
MHFLAIAQHDDHGCLALHLFLIIEIFGVGLLAGRGFLGRRTRGTISIPVSVPNSIPDLDGRVVMTVINVSVIGAVEGRADELAVREAILIGGWFS